MLEWLIPAGIAAGGLGAIFSGISGIFGSAEAERHNLISENVSNEQNSIARDTLNWNKSNALQTFEYNKWLNQEQMNREDTAIQRRVADLRAAGLSPLLAAGQSASASAGSQLTAPNVESADLQSPDYIDSSGPFRQGVQSMYQGLMQGIKTYKDSQLADANVSNIASQTEKNMADTQEKNLSNQYLEQKLIDDASTRSAEIKLKIQTLRNLEKSGANLDVDNEIKNLEKVKRIFDNQIAAHDWKIINQSPLPSPIVLQGARSNLGRTVQDIMQMLGLSNGETLNNDGNDNFVSTGSAVEQVPNIFDSFMDAVNSINPFKKRTSVNPDGSVSSGNVDFDIFNGASVNGRTIKRFRAYEALQLDKQGKKIPNSWFVEPVESHNRFFHGFSHSGGIKHGYSGRTGRF